MPKTDGSGARISTKIAAIQEHSNFPAVENGLPASDIDLPVRDGFAQHLLVGLNVFLIDMADQFSRVFGITTSDPMLSTAGVPPLQATRNAMLEQAAKKTAILQVTDARTVGTNFTATVTVVNKAGHKLPSGVGFRRAFVDLRVLDSGGTVLWESGRTDQAGVIVDQNGQPIAGEIWWQKDCSARITPNAWQPHYQVISRQDQAQIYQELVTAPASGKPANCVPSANAEGQLTTSFLSICGRLKDNRLLPDGFLSMPERLEIAHALGAGDDLAQDTSPVGVEDDPDYRDGGRDTLRYDIPLADISGQPAQVEAVLYYQASPPFYLQDRFCTAKGPDRDRLAYIAGGLKLEGKPEAQWKLRLVSSGMVPVNR